MARNCAAILWGILKNDVSDIFILSDGMGSGVKANILSTLTTKIVGTMLRDGANISDCVETIAKTLPVCRVRHVAYSTFTILQIFKDGRAYLVEYDNPGCVLVRSGKLEQIPYEVHEIEGKKIRGLPPECSPGRLFCIDERWRYPRRVWEI